MMISIGLLSDVHYAEGKTNGNRYCNLSDTKLSACLDCFRQEKLEHVICLGDLIDKGDHHADDQKNLTHIARILNKYQGSVHTVIGNHDLDSMTKEYFLEHLGLKTKKPNYSFVIGEYHFIVLDPNYKQTGEAYTPGGFVWDDCCLPKDQIQWLSLLLNQHHYRRTFILSHQNLDHRIWKGLVDPHIISNAGEIRKLFEETTQKITVIQGHYHHGYFQKMNGISYLTLAAMCEGDSLENNTFAVMDIHDDGCVAIRGFGDQASMTIESSFSYC